MLRSVALFAGVFSVWAAILQVHLRNIRLTALVLLAPAPLVVAVWWLWSRFEVDTFIAAVSGYALGIVSAQLTAERTVQGVCGGLASGIAASRARDGIANSIGPVIFAFAAWMLATSLLPFAPENFAAASLPLAAFAGALAAMPLAGVFPYSELSIAEANQARERRERMIDHIMFVTETRWSFSIAGVVLIFVALAAFGMRGLRIPADPWIVERLALLAIFAFAAAIAATRDWRLSLALTLTLALLAALAFWGFARGVRPMQRSDLLNMASLLAASAVPLIVLAVSASVHLRQGDDISLALQRALQATGPGAIFAAAIVSVPWIAAALSGATVRFELAVSLAGIVAVPLIFPALATAVYAALPRYRTADEIFGKR